VTRECHQLAGAGLPSDALPAAFAQVVRDAMGAERVALLRRATPAADELEAWATIGFCDGPSVSIPASGSEGAVVSVGARDNEVLCSQPALAGLATVLWASTPQHDAALLVGFGPEPRPSCEADVAALRDLLAVFLDVLAQRRAVEQVTVSEARYRQLAESSKDMIWTADLAPRLTYMAPSVADVLQYSPDEVVGTCLWDLLTAQSAAVANAAYTRAIVAEAVEKGSTGATPVEMEFRRKDGSSVWTESTLCFLRGPANAPVGLLGVTRDITERKRAEQSHRLASVGQLAAGFAHEFNNLLAIMSGRAQLTPTDHTNGYLQLRDTVLRATERGSQICNGLMSYARPQAPHPEPMRVETAIDDALAMARREIDNADVRVKRLYRTGNRQIHADSGQLQEAFLSLIVNACHAMRDGGVLTIETGVQSGTSGHERIVVSVADTGIGIEAEDLPHIFEPFFTTKGRLGGSDIPGTGLGLFVTHSIITAHGGSIAAVSRPGEGTTVEVRLDALPAAPGRTSSNDAGEAEDACASQPPRPRILLAEDEPELREIVAEVLRAEGCDVTAVSGTQDALSELRRGGYSAIVCDLMMPGGGGREVLAASRALSDPPPLVIITGRAEAGVTDELLASGAVACLHKPFGLPELVATVEGALVRSA